MEKKKSNDLNRYKVDYFLEYRKKRSDDHVRRGTGSIVIDSPSSKRKDIVKLFNIWLHKKYPVCKYRIKSITETDRRGKPSGKGELK